MLSYALVDAFTRVERHDAITRLKNAIAEAGGVIVDFAFFSNRAIRLSVELEADAVPQLRRALEASDVHLFEKCAADLDRSAPTASSATLVMAMLHVAFVYEEADRLVALAG